MHFPTLALAATLFPLTYALLPPPPCQSAAPPQRDVVLPSAQLNLTGVPFGLTYISSTAALVVIDDNLTVLDTSTLLSSIKHAIRIPSEYYNASFGVGDMTLSQDKTTLHLASGSGVVIFDVQSVLAADGPNDSTDGNRGTDLGALTSTTGNSAIHVTLSKDEDFAFVTQEYGARAEFGVGGVDVFALNKSTSDNASAFSGGTFIGSTTLGFGPVGTALSANGKLLYALSQLSLENALRNATRGTLSVLDVATLQTQPADAVLRVVEAGCQPVRVITAPDGKTLWVTARASNRLLAFDTVALESNDTLKDALIANVQIGTAPVGLAFVNGGKFMVTADSNRFNESGIESGMSLIDVEAALDGKEEFPRLRNTVYFPRELAVSPDGNMLLLAQYDSRAVMAIDMTDLARVITNVSTPAAGGPSVGAGIRPDMVAGWLLGVAALFLS